MSKIREQRSPSDPLAASAAARAADALAAAQRAITRLEARGLPVTFAGVAKEGGVSVSYVYKNDEVARRIRALRGVAPQPQQQRPSKEPSALSLRTKLAAAVARNQELESELIRLKAENRTPLSRLMQEP